ncbi:alpha-ketoglutarate-dependent dioxygenase AlkB [Neoroseomonas alba]
MPGVGVPSWMTLHQDKNERGFDAPIVSVSLGLPAVFLWGGLKCT